MALESGTACPERTATTPQHARSLQRHECPGHRHPGQTGQRLIERMGDLAENRGNQPAARRLEDQSLLIRSAKCEVLRHPRGRFVHVRRPTLGSGRPR